MLAAFWEDIADKVTDRWAQVTAPALAFWSGALLAWIFHGGTTAIQNAGLKLGHQSAPVQLAVLVVILLWVGLSATVVDRLSMPVLRLLEGYWPPFLMPAHKRLSARAEAKAAGYNQSFQAVAPSALRDGAPDRAKSEYITLDRQLHWLPRGGPYQPTTVGNVLRAAEARPREKYGLDAVIVWPRLWLLLPDTARAELAAARRALDLATGACIWGALFILFTPLAWWAAALGLAVVIVAYRFWLVSRAIAFADLLDAAFDLYRRLLYEQLHWPLPANPVKEREAGAQLTEYLWRGSAGMSPSPSSTPPKS
jgi:hypothetical protein